MQRRRSAPGSGKGDYDLVNIERQGGTRSPIGGPLWDAVAGVRRAGGAGRCRRADLRRRLHRLALAAPGVRHRRLRVLPVARDGRGDGGAADPLRGRARSGRGPRARRALAAARGAVRLRVDAMLELHEAEGAFDHLEQWLAAELRLVTRRRLPRLRPQRAAAPDGAPAPPEPCPLPLLAANRTACANLAQTGFAVGEWEPTWAADDYAAAIEAVRAAIARGDVYQVNLVQHLAAPFDGDPCCARRGARAASAAAPAAARRRATGRSSRRRPSSSSRGAATCFVTMPIKGTRPAGEDIDDAKDAAEHMMIVDLERNDLSRVCEPGTVRWPELMVQRELAGVTHLVSTVEGRLRPGVGLAEILHGDCSRAARSPARRRSPRSTTSRRSSRSAAARRWARSGRSRRTATSTSR